MQIIRVKRKRDLTAPQNLCMCLDDDVVVVNTQGRGWCVVVMVTTVVCQPV